MQQNPPEPHIEVKDIKDILEMDKVVDDLWGHKWPPKLSAQPVEGQWLPPATLAGILQHTTIEFKTNWTDLANHKSG